MRTLALLTVLAVAVGAAPARPQPAAPATVLVGQDWLGLWRDGGVAVTRPLPGWTLGAARLDQAAGAVEVAAHRSDGSGAADTLLRFDARTLAPRGQGNDPALATTTVRTPIGTDDGDPDDAARLPRAVSAQLGKGVRRVVLSPDGSTAAVFARPAKGAVWRGVAWDARAGRSLAAPGLSIDDGTPRGDGAARSVACLLPHGGGAIYTYIGAPADRFSTYERFGAGAKPVRLKTPYVMSCLAPS